MEAHLQRAVAEVASGARLPDNSFSGALEASRVVKAGGGALYGFTVLNTNASAQYVQLFDSQTLLANGAVPVLVIAVAGAVDREIEWLTPRQFDRGIVICNSSTAATKTIGSADCYFDVQFL